MNKTILILGACGQIGTELTLALRQKYGNESVVASDIRRSDLAELQDGPFEILDASDADALRAVCERYNDPHRIPPRGHAQRYWGEIPDEGLGPEHAKLAARAGIGP